MTPSVFHVPPRPPTTGASVWGAPPPRSGRLSAPPAKKPTDRPSGDQNGKVAPSVPFSACAVVAARDRTQSRDTPSSEATNTIRRPSGESANDPGSSVVGVLISVRVSGGAGGISRRCRSASTASATIPSAATANAAVHTNRPADADGAAAVCDAAVSNAPSSASRTSAISCARCFASFRRHTRSAWLTRAGTSAGSAAKSGSLLITDTIVSVTSSPGNARVPVSIS